jgi:hypothetical protein
MTGTISPSVTGPDPEYGEMDMRMIVTMSDSRGTLKMGIV